MTSLLRVLLAATAAVAAPTRTSAAEHQQFRPNGASPLEVRGVVLAPDRVELRSDISAAVEMVAIREGESFGAGETLLRFDCRRTKAEHAAAVARARVTALDLKQQTHLHALGAGAASDVQHAKVRSQAAIAEVDMRSTDLESCEVLAPFAGRAAVVNARSHAQIERGQPLLTIVGAGALEVELIAPSHALRSIEQGTAFRLVIDETGESYVGHVDRIAAEVDPASRTIKLYGTLDAPSDRILPGMAGVAHFGDLQ